ncbi:MAG: ABC transporter substrate-binding protein [Acidimicrobiia bacterium]|nr:ABC transporter substrate-binding protein [Acidimicrobiia bacterium]
MTPDVSRRQVLRWGMFAGIGAAASPILAACSSGSSAKGTGASDTIKVGVIAPFSGIGSFVGDITHNSLDAALQQINSTGGVGGRKVELVLRDAGQQLTDGVKAYQEFAGDPHVAGVLWCGGLGFDESRNLIRRDQMPSIAVFEDPASSNDLYPAVPERSVFQVDMPENLQVKVLCRYLAQDRGYKRVGLLFDSTISEGVKTSFTAAASQYGLTPAGIEDFTVFSTEYGPQLQRLKNQHPEALLVWGLSSNTAGVAQQLDQLGAGYIDTPSAKGGAWHPHVVGAPTGTGDKSFADLATTAAKTGTVTAWHLGGLVYLPTFAIGQWMKKYLNKTATGGEELPADGLGTVTRAIEKGGSTDHRRVVNTIETMGRFQFASVEFGFAPQNHLARTEDELIVVTLERSSGPAPTDPPYQLGREWRDVFPPGYAGPTQLVRPTLDANRRAHPDVVDQVLREGWGTQCTRHPDGSLGAECKIH